MPKLQRTSLYKSRWGENRQCIYNDLEKTLLHLNNNRHGRISIHDAARHLLMNNPNYAHYKSPSCIQTAYNAFIQAKGAPSLKSLTRYFPQSAREFTYSLADDSLIETVADAGRIWSAASLMGKKPSITYFSVNWKEGNAPLPATEKFPPHLTSKNLTSATSALRLLKARAQYRHPHDQPAAIIEQAMPDYLLREMIGKWLAEWQSRNAKNAIPQPSLPTRQTAAPAR